MKNRSTIKISMFLLASAVFWGFGPLLSVPVARAACSNSEATVGNSIGGVSPSGTFSNPSSISINVSGSTVFVCVSGTGYRDTALSWSIANSLGQTMANGGWDTPASWTNQIAGGAVGYDGSPLGFSNGYYGESVNVSAWPADSYTVTYTSSDVTGFNVGGTYSASSSFVITRPSACAIGSFTCDPNATLSWSTSNCSSVSVSPTVGSVPATGNTQGQVGTTYTLTADGSTSFASCPAPTLTTSGGGSQTVTPGTTVTLPGFNFSNTGQSGSLIHYQNCVPDASGGGLTPNDVSVSCPSPHDLIAP